MALPGSIGRGAFKHIIQLFECPGEYGPHSDFFFFLIRSHEGSAVQTLVSAETLKACALIGLHLLAAGGDAGSSGSQSPCGHTSTQKSPEWDSANTTWKVQL